MFWLVSIACVGGCLFNFKYRGLRGFAMVPGASFALHASHQVGPPSPSLCTFFSPFPSPTLPAMPPRFHGHGHAHPAAKPLQGRAPPHARLLTLPTSFARSRTRICLPYTDLPPVHGFASRAPPVHGFAGWSPEEGTVGAVTGQVAEKVGSLSAPKQGGHQVSFTYAPEGSMPVSIVTEAQHLRQADSLAPL